MTVGKPLRPVIGLAIAALIVGLVGYWYWQRDSGPPPDFAWHVDGAVVEDLRFSPDGKLLAVIARDDRNVNSPQHASVHRAATGELIHKIDDAALACAWSADGSALAVVAFDPWYVDIWDTANWTRRVRLGYMDSPEHKDEATIIRPRRLCFDRPGNLYLSDWIDFDGTFSPELLGFRVWQNAAKGAAKLQIVNSYNSRDLACATVGTNTRLAFPASAARRSAPASPARVVTIAGSPVAKPRVLREYNLPGLVNAALEMTPDGRYLIARDSAAITAVELFDDHGKVLWSLPDDLGVPSVTEPMHAFALSANGELAFGGTDGHVKVIRIADRDKLLDLDFGKSGGEIALSPDGQLLAMSDDARRRIRFYKVPPRADPERKSGDAP